MKEDSLSNRAYTALRKKILSNQLTSGIRLKEDEWSKKLDAQERSPVGISFGYITISHE